MEQRRPDPPAPDAGHPPADAGASKPDRSLPPDAEQRPIGALAIVGFLTLTILVFWYGMFALNLVRN